jgi:fermentation-respiration switch protein FrsA (DUF1100 family)
MAEPVTRRWQAQRWLIDNVIRTVGMDFDQNRSGYLAGPCGPDAAGDFQIIRQRIQKFADFAPAFETAARRREERARAAEGQGRLVTAREHYFTAAIQWGAAQWTVAENNDTNLFYNQRKVECYGRYGHLADHHVERVLIPFRDKALPAWFHLPPDYRGERVPTIVAIPGMDSFKETSVTLYGDRWLTRGCAVLALDGPGQYESPVLGVYVTVQNWVDAARIVFDWVAARPEVDVDRVGVIGNSFGSLFGTIVAGAEPRYRACAVSGVIHEPGCHTIFEEASPTFKQRFMYMAGYEDEDPFDEFAKSLTWEGWAERIRCPYLCLAGEADELSPLVYTERLLAALTVPRLLVVYQDARHSLGASPSTTLGPSPRTLMADWMVARLAGQAMESERWNVEASGRIARSPL